MFMKRFLLALTTTLLTTLAWAQSPGMFTTKYRVEVRFSDLTNQEVILGHHFGKTQYTVDSATIDENGVAVFEGEGDTLRYGVYLVYVPNVRYFDFLFNEPEIVMETSIENPVADMNVVKSKENRIFFDYLNFLSDKMAEARTLQDKLKTASAEEKEALTAEREALDNTVTSYMDNFVTENKGTLAASVVGINQEVKVPNAPEGTENPQEWQYYYYYDHFWDHVNLSDERLLYSPWMQQKLEQYMTKLTLQHPDTVNAAADRVVNLTEGNKETFRYVVNWITNHYETSNLMSSETIFVHMVDNYYTPDQAWWVNAGSLFRIQDRAKILRPLLVGKKLPNLVIKDFNDNFQNLHKSEGKYTVLFFYDPDCGHCKKAAPLVEEVRKKYGAEGVEFWGVALDLDDSPESREKWKSFIEEKGLQEWTNVSDLSHTIPIQYTYDVRTTPTIIVVDEEKKTILRRIGAEQLGEVLGQVITNDKAAASGESRP